MLFLEITLSWSRALQSSCCILPHEMNKQSVLFYLGLSPLAVYFRSSRSLTMVVLCDIIKTAALGERDDCASCFTLGETVVDQKTRADFQDVISRTGRVTQHFNINMTNV